MLEPRGFTAYREAAAVFHLARAKGITLTTIDTPIAAIALEHGASVFTLDKGLRKHGPHYSALLVYDLSGGEVKPETRLAPSFCFGGLDRRPSRGE